MSEKSSTYLTIMSKNDMFSFLGLVGLEMVDSNDTKGPITAVIKLDPREGQPVMREYPSRNEAIRQYRDAITTSEARGWQIIYRGHPIWG